MICPKTLPTNFQKKNRLEAEKKDYKTQKEQAKEFEELFASKEKKQQQQFLYNLQYIGENEKSHENELKQLNVQLTRVKEKQTSVKKELTDKQKEQAKFEKDLKIITNNIKKKERIKSRKRRNQNERRN